MRSGKRSRQFRSFLNAVFFARALALFVTPLARLGYARPTPVQSESIPVVLDGRDMLARAQTGTGKTAAFGLPMIDRLLLRGRRQTRRASRAASSSCRHASWRSRSTRRLRTYGLPARLRATAIFGGVPMRPQTQALQRGTDIVVATPGRLIDHLERRTVDLSAIEILTLDEADRMLDMGFLPALRRVLAALPQSRQTLLFSATLSDEVVQLSSAFTREPVRIDVTDGHVVAPTVTHRIHPVSDSRKADLLTHVLTQPPIGQALVFCKTKRGSNRVGERLERAGVKAAVIHGNKSQGARNRALGDFKAGRVTVLVATDIAARGLDIVQLPLVVNFDLPLVAADYIHRIGRTGRAGLAGRADFPGHCRRARLAARHPAALAGSARAGRRRRLRGEARVARRALRGTPPQASGPPAPVRPATARLTPFQRRVRLQRPGRPS